MVEEYLDSLTEEDYKIAESNGISRKLAKFRYEQGGMDLNKAITQPVRVQKNEWKLWKEVAEKNGISQNLFYKRTGKDIGWSAEQAATVPPLKNGQSYTSKKKVIPEELLERAAQNGISRGTLYQRLFRYHMNEETAVNKPTKGARKIWR